MKRLLLIGLAAAIVAGSGSTASAGGWAVSTLDAIPSPAAGEEIDIGFTIRQHGVTPVDLDEGVGIEVMAADGTSELFPGVGDGEIGHYVATVSFPETGSYTWVVKQGWFADHELGTIEVGPPQGSRGGGAKAFGRAVSPFVLALAAVVAAGLLVDRRRRGTALT